jgi:chromosomal replication initiator protein
MSSARYGELSLRPLGTLWERVRNRLESGGTSPSIDCWLEDVDLREDTEGNLVVFCSNAFSRNWIQDRYHDTLVKLLKEETGREVSVAFDLHSCAEPATARSCEEVRHEVPMVNLAARGLPSASIPGLESCHPQAQAAPLAGWNPRYQFENFVVGDSNRFAWAASQEICRHFRREYNPLLVQSPTGLGKTHLGQAIAHALHLQDPTRRIRCCTSEHLFTDMIQHMRDRNILAFKDKYRKDCDAIVLDDIQFACRKNGLQSELTYTLDELLNSGKQVVLLANLPPEGRSDLQEGFRSRIFSGLTVSIDMPDFDMRLAILRQFAHSASLPLSEATLEAVAHLVRSHVRDIEAAFNRLVATHCLSNRAIDPGSAEELLKDLAPVERLPLTIQDILDHVSRYFGIDTESLRSRSRQRKLLVPRQIAMFLSRKHTAEPLQEVGKHFKKDHSSVLYAVRSLERKLEQNPRLRRETEFIEDRLLGRTR